MMSKTRQLIDALRNSRKTISVMESCTGGALSNTITSQEHSSEVFKFGAVTYVNEYKIKFGVDANIIDKYSVYSIETAKEMSRAIVNFTGADYGVGITGKLGSPDDYNPTGDDREVYISVYNGENYYTHTLKVTCDTRIDNKMQVVDSVVTLLLTIM